MQGQHLFQAEVGTSEAQVAKVSHLSVWTSLVYILLLVYMLLIIATFSTYGITYDENWQTTYGEHIIHWYTSGFQDTSALTYRNLIFYGGFFAVIERLAANLSPLGSFETGHFINALFGLFAAVGVYKLGKLLAGPPAGFFSALFLIMTPRFYGHAFNNPVDIPFATLSLWAIYYLIQLIPLLPHPPLSLIAKLGITIGLALGIRIGGILLLGYTALAGLLWLFDHARLRDEDTQQSLPFLSNVRKLIGIGLIIGVIAYLVMLAWWPAAQVQPIVIPAQALRNTLQFAYTFDIYFAGKYISTADLPWYYISKWFYITLPEFYFIALATGAALGVRAVLARKNWGHCRSVGALPIIILTTTALFPIVYTSVTRPVDYDEVRHYLFIIPLLATLAGITIATVVARAKASIVSIALMGAISGSLMMTGVDMVQLHPNQYIYFNRIFGGGVADASKSFETDYWGNSYKEGVEWVVQNYTQQPVGDKLTVASCLYSLSTAYFLPTDRFIYVGSFHDGQPIVEGVTPDLFLATPRWNCDKKLPGRVVHTVTRQGAALLYIIEVARESALSKSSMTEVDHDNR